MLSKTSMELTVIDKKNTEQLLESAVGLDLRPAHEVAALLAQGQIAAVTSVLEAIEGISAGAVAMANSIRCGACIHYIAAGSSGLMAAADALELGGTYSIPGRQLHIHMAGGLPTGIEMPGAPEDETQGLDAELAGLSPADTVVAVSASGSTPYTLAAARIAKASGALLVGMANNRDTELLAIADQVILLETPPEVISGSTRMGAATAQKTALNMMSTLMAIRLGHVHDGMMVNLLADNTKLRGRATGIVQRIAQVPQPAASDALSAANGHVKSAVLIAACGMSREAAAALLAETGGHLRPALGRSNCTSTTKPPEEI